MTSASIRFRPGNRLRASSHANPEPATNAINVAAVACEREPDGEPVDHGILATETCDCSSADLWTG